MTQKSQVVLEEALKLNAHERAEVAEQAWQEEVQRRLQQVERGEVKAVPWAEVQRL